MKFSAAAAFLLSISFSSASPLFRRDESCKIISPDGFISIPVSELYTGTYADHSKLTSTKDFEASYTTVNGVSFSGLSGGNGPCALKFFFKSPDAFTSSGTGQLNVYRVDPDVDAKKALDSTYLLGTVNVRKYDPKEFPKVFEINSPACPASGALIVGFVAAADDGTVVKFTQKDYEGLFVFKGNCYGQPKEGDYQVGGGGGSGYEGSGDDNKGDDYKGEDNKGDDYKQEENKGDDYKQEENKGDDYKGNDNKGDDYKGEDNKGDDYKGEDNKGDDYKGEDNKGNDYKGGDDKGDDYQGGDDKEKGYEGGDDSKDKKYEA